LENLEIEKGFQKSWSHPQKSIIIESLKQVKIGKNEVLKNFIEQQKIH